MANNLRLFRTTTPEQPSSWVEVGDPIPVELSNGNRPSGSVLVTGLTNGVTYHFKWVTFGVNRNVESPVFTVTPTALVETVTGYSPLPGSTEKIESGVTLQAGKFTGTVNSVSYDNADGIVVKFTNNSWVDVEGYTKATTDSTFPVSPELRMKRTGTGSYGTYFAIPGTARSYFLVMPRVINGVIQDRRVVVDPGGAKTDVTYLATYA